MAISGRTRTWSSRTERRADGDALTSPRRRARVVATRYGRRDYLMRRVLAAADVTGNLLATITASSFTPADDSRWVFIGLNIALVPVWIVLFKAYGLYERDMKRVSHTTVDDVPWVFHSLVMGSLLSWALFKLVDSHLVFAEVLTFGITGMAAVLVLRSAVRGAGVRLLGNERVLLVGNEQMLDVLLKKMHAHPEYGLEPVGVVSTSPNGNGNGNGNGAGGARSSVPNLGRVEQLPALVEECAAERLVISHTGLANDQVIELLRRCKTLSLKVSLLPQVFDALGPSVEVDDVEGVTLLGINAPVMPRSSRFLKRTMDIVGSALILCLTAPLLTLIAIAIKLDSPGPVLFHQIRIGKGDRRFRVLKFRTMVRDAEKRRAELVAQSIDPDWLHLEDDPRITRVGRLLRELSLDELPQLFNVLKGDMSLVGPRPLIEAEDRRVEGWARGRLDLTPGITGLWQVLGRTNIPFSEMVKLDYLYVTNWSLWTDVRLILRTLPVVFLKRGAN